MMRPMRRPPSVEGRQHERVERHADNGVEPRIGREGVMAGLSATVSLS